MMVSALKAKVERGGVITVGDPPVARKMIALALAPLVLRRFHPSGTPIEMVKVDNRQSGAST
jgi:hypothetical protein